MLSLQERYESSSEANTASDDASSRADRYTPRVQRTMRVWLGLAVLLLGCRSNSADLSAEKSDVVALRATLDELYRAFCFDAGGQADWNAMVQLFAEGAAFVAPVVEGRAPKAVGTEQFLHEFKEYVASDAVRSTGLHERILNVRLDVYGCIAHAFVAFEGFEPGSARILTRGLDSLQLVRDGEHWKVASFTTQYESEKDPFPGRFLISQHH